MVLYLTYWIPAAERARTGALFMMAAPVAVIVGAPLSEALLRLDGWLGLHGWQWLFLVEGLPAVVLGVIALLVLTDRPEQATWLPPRNAVADRRRWPAEQAQRQAAGHTSFARSLVSRPGVAALRHALHEHARQLRDRSCGCRSCCRTSPATQASS